MRADRLDLNDRTADRYGERWLRAAPDDQLDLAAGGTAHLLDGVVEAHARNRLTVDGDDQVAGFEAGLGRGRAVDRRHHFYQAVLHRHFDAEAAEFALDLH